METCGSTRPLADREEHHGRGDGLKAKVQLYTLATLAKPVEGGTARLETWIRVEVAVVGRLLRNLKDADTGEVRHGWTVESVGDTQRAESTLLARLHKHGDLSRKCDM